MKDKNNSNFSTLWVRYSDYEFRKVDDEIYITPTYSATAEPFDPFKYTDTILVDILNIGRLNSLDKTNLVNEKVLEFVKKYGLLGFFTYCPLNSKNLFTQKTVYLKKNNFITKKESMPFKGYIDLFLKCDDTNIIELHKGDIGYFASYNNEMSPNLILNKDLEYGIVFSKGYSEKLSWFLDYVNEIYQQFFSIGRYYITNELVEKRTADLYIQSFMPDNISCNLTLTKNKPTLAWNFNSLRLALDTMLYLELSAERQLLKMCKHCYNPFYSNNPKSEYCSPQCRNQANVYKSRGKKKDQ